MNWSKKFVEYTERFWQLRREKLGELSEKVDSYLAGCTGEEALLLKYVLASAPLSDISDYEISSFGETVNHALRVREEFPWAKELPEHLFLLHVLPPRINTEQLSSCRPLFYSELKERVGGLALKDAILEVNRWCAEHVTYRSTDDRTASALAVYSCGWGRCGEESTFAVNALRSVGIAARQIYAPWWSHCDDNHAWVEVWDGGKWRCLGACEPEPELDRGWFTTAASRAMMIHTRAFLPGGQEDFAFLFPDADPMDLLSEDGVVYGTVTHHYGETVPVKITVQNEDGEPVPGAKVTCSVLNMSAWMAITVLKTGQTGSIDIRLGKGSVYLSVKSDNKFAELTVNTNETRKIKLVLREKLKSAEWEDFDFSAPAGMAGYPAQLTGEQKELRASWLEEAARLRKAHHPEKDVSPALSVLQSRVFRTLTGKDQAGPLPLAVLDECAGALAWEDGIPSDVFECCLLSPRIGLEPLAPWRKALSEAVSPELAAHFRVDPRTVWAWIQEHIADAASYDALPGTPAGAMALKAATPAGKAVLFCAICRAVGVPARLSPLGGQPEYWQDGVFHPLFAERSASLTLHAPADQHANPGQNFSLSTFMGSKWETINLRAMLPGEAAAYELVPGDYRLITAVRLPNGGQLAKKFDFSLASGENRTVFLKFRELETAHLFTDILLPPISLWDTAGEEGHAADLLAEKPCSVLLWLEPGREPTEHILNELRESAVDFAACGCGIHLILPDFTQRENPTLQSALAVLPQARLWRGDFRDTVPALARRLFTDPEKLPLISLSDCKGKSLYATAGYNVGTAELLLRLMESAAYI